MTENQRIRVEEIRKDKLFILERRVNLYTDLVDYWVTNARFRMIGKSNRLNQSAEFIAHQGENAITELGLAQNELNVFVNKETE